MRFTKLLLIQFMISAVCISGCAFDANNDISNTENSSYSEENYNSKESETSPYDLSFAVFGDVHDNESDFQDAVDDIKNTDIKLDALVLNGDTVDQGIDSQYETMTNALEKNSEKLPDVIIKNIGNHEFYNYEQSNKTKEDVDEKIQKYLDFAGEDKVYHDKWVKGYHFISLGSEDGNSPTCSSTSAYFSDAQINWFKEKLAENYECGRPIFVFIHQPLIFNWGWGDIPGSNKTDTLTKILSEYPEAIVFTSHIHKQMSDECINTDKIFTTAQTGAVSYTLFINSDGSVSRDYSFTNGLYVTVIGNDVTIKGRDLKNGAWICSKDITFKK